MLIFGASGHAKVVFDCLISQKIKLMGVFDDDLGKTLFLGRKLIGPYKSTIFPAEKIIIAIGDNKIRKELSKKIKHPFGTICHNSSIISPSVIINEGTVIFQGAIIQSSTIIGKHCIINTNSSIDHDCEIGDFVHIAPNATICGGVKVGSGTLVGAGSTILPNIKIGRNVIIGAGSVVISDIVNDTTVFGNPAKLRINE